MSDVTNTKVQTVELSPTQIKIDPRYNVRPYSTEHNSEQQQKKIDELAISIDIDGQRVPAVVTADYTMLSGHRRLAAIIMVNGRRTTLGKPLLKVRCEIDPCTDPIALMRRCIIDNEQREGLSPMDKLRVIQKLRRDNNWFDPGHKARIGQYFGRTAAWVGTVEKLSKASPALQQRVHNGYMKMDTALLLTACLNAQQQDEVIEEALERKQEDILDKALVEAKQHNIGSKRTTRKLIAIGEKQCLEKPDIIKVMREKFPGSMNGTGKIIPLERRELLDTLDGLSTLPITNEAREFLLYYTHDYADGKGKLDILKTKFLAIVARLRKRSG